MYAVFQIGTKQYRVVLGQVCFIEKINIEIGNKIEFDQVLFINKGGSLIIGDPFIKSAKVVAKVLKHVLSKKIEIIKFKRRKHYRKFQGHRQYITKIGIVSINGD